MEEAKRKEFEETLEFSEQSLNKARELHQETECQNKDAQTNYC